ncbi:MAG TPA: FKBP-type peptidyl-prolyl cis-trans isomerase [Crinalium sp.]|jgi:hypothetical protein
MAIDPGKTRQTARAFPISEISKTVKETLSLRDQVDIWKFKLGTKSRFNLTLSGIAPKANIDVSLLNAAGQAISFSKQRGNRPEKLTNLQLDASTFYVRVQLQRGSTTSNYALKMLAAPIPATTPTPTPSITPTPTPTPSLTPTPTPADQFGNSFDTATALSINTPGSVTDFVGAIDANDFLKFTLSNPGQLSLNLTGLSADANIELYDNNRNLVSAGNNVGIVNDAIAQRLINFNSTYYIRVAQAPGNDTTYNLSYSFTPDTPVTTASGLKYVDLVTGTGVLPKKGQHVVVHYTGTLVDGTKFDSSRDRNQPFQFALGYGEVIQGWDEALSTMTVGSRRQLIIPPNLGYGSQSVSTIPPNSTLIFDVELLDITDLVGDSFDQASSFTLANPSSTSPTSASLNEFVGNSDPNDFLKFTLPRAGQLALKLTNLAGDANLELYDSNRNLIQSSTNNGLTNENIAQTLNSVNSTYYIRVTQAPNTDAGYKFSYTFTPS